MISAIKCLKCDKGFMLPKDPVDLESEWVCIDECCDGCSMSVETVKRLLRALEISVEKVSLEENIDDTKNIYEALCCKLGLNKALHPNHFLRIRLRERVIQYYRKMAKLATCIETRLEALMNQVDVFKGLFDVMVTVDTSSELWEQTLEKLEADIRKIDQASQ